MAEDGTESRRARVRRLLIQPLEDAGMRRPSGWSLAEYQAFLGRLQDRLGYMDEGNLTGMRALLFAKGRGKDHDIWPKEVTIMFIARNLQAPPPRECDYAASVMRSAMGRAARAQGYHVELLDVARRLGPPPGRYDLARLEREAKDNRAARRKIEAQIARDAASVEDRQWLRWYMDLEAECAAIQQDETEAVA